MRSDWYGRPSRPYFDHRSEGCIQPECKTVPQELWSVSWSCSAWNHEAGTGWAPPPRGCGGFRNATSGGSVVSGWLPSFLGTNPLRQELGWEDESTRGKPEDPGPPAPEARVRRWMRSGSGIRDPEPARRLFWEREFPQDAVDSLSADGFGLPPESEDPFCPKASSILGASSAMVQQLQAAAGQAPGPSGMDEAEVDTGHESSTSTLQLENEAAGSVHWVQAEQLGSGPQADASHRGAAAAWGPGSDMEAGEVKDAERDGAGAAKARSMPAEAPRGAAELSAAGPASREPDLIHVDQPGIPACAKAAMKLKKQTRVFLHIDARGSWLPSHEVHPECAKEVVMVQRESGWSARWQELKAAVWLAFMDPESSWAAYFISVTILVLIICTSSILCVETLPFFEDRSNSIAQSWRSVFDIIESVCILIFTLEYVLKLISAPNRWSFLRSPLELIDLLAIAPWYLEHILASASSASGLQVSTVLRAVRLVRIFRIIKLGKRYNKLQLVFEAIKDSLDMLGMLVFLLALAIIFFSSLLFQLERGEKLPEAGIYVRRAELEAAQSLGLLPPASPFSSIPSSCWYTIVTLMTVGYGDVVPLTVMGKLVAGSAMVVSLLISALPISVIGANFTQQWTEYNMRGRVLRCVLNVPRAMRDLRDQLTPHVQNADDMVKRFSDINNDMRGICQTVERKKKAKEHRQTASHPKWLSASEVRKALAQRLGNSNGHDDEGQELEELQHSVADRLRFLQDLLAATELLLSLDLAGKVKACRLDYRTLDLLQQQSQLMISALSSCATDLQELDRGVGQLDWRSDGRSSGGDMPWGKRRFSRVLKTTHSDVALHAASFRAGGQGPASRAL